MPTPKQHVIESLQQLPDDASHADMLYRVYVLTKLRAGMDDAAAGRTISHEQVLREIFEELHDDTPDDIDFAGGERGKFYRPGAELRLPVYLDAGVQNTLVAIANAKGIDLSVFVNELLKKDIELIQMGR
jgi:hypothetical protein